MASPNDHGNREDGNEPSREANPKACPRQQSTVVPNGNMGDKAQNASRDQTDQLNRSRLARLDSKWVGQRTKFPKCFRNKRRLLSQPLGPRLVHRRYVIYLCEDLIFSRSCKFIGAPHGRRKRHNPANWVISPFNLVAFLSAR